MRLFDTNLLIHSAKAQYAWLRPHLLRPGGYVSAISKVETLGFTRLLPVDALYYQTLFGQMTVLPVDELVLERAIWLRQQRKMSLGDSIIAGTALEAGISLLYTENVKDFAHIVELQVINPFDAPSAMASVSSGGTDAPF